MSKQYRILTDDYICTELETLRKMHETRDYSGLAAVIERIQIHANAMESGLYWYRGSFHEIDNVLKDKKLTNPQKLAKISKKVKEKLEQQD